MKLKILAAAASTFILLAGGVKAADEVVVLEKSKPMVAQSAGQQRFVDYVNIKGGQEKLPLTLTFHNGTDTAPAFSQLRISIAGTPYLTETDFKGNVMSVDMSRTLGAGASQVVVYAAGPAGATLSWQLTTPKVKLAAVNPDKAATGATVSLKGENFLPNPGDNTVKVGAQTAQVTSASTTQLQIKVPEDAQGGPNKVTVTVSGIQSDPVTLTVTPKPVVTSVDLFSAPPGQPLTISGKNFSTNVKDIKVYLGEFQAEVTRASQTSVTAIIPMSLDPVQPRWGLPVVVEVNGVKSNDDVTFNVQNRFIPADEGTIPPPREGTFYGEE